MVAARKCHCRQSARDHPRSSVRPAATPRILSSKSSHGGPGVPSCGVVSYFTSTVAISHHLDLPTMFPAVAPRCYSAQGFRVNQSVYTTAATRAATWSTAPVYCPFRVNYKVHTQLTLLHYCDRGPILSHTHSTRSHSISCCLPDSLVMVRNNAPSWAHAQPHVES